MSFTCSEWKNLNREADHPEQPLDSPPSWPIKSKKDPGFRRRVTGLNSWQCAGCRAQVHPAVFDLGRGGRGRQRNKYCKKLALTKLAIFLRASLSLKPFRTCGRSCALFLNWRKIASQCCTFLTYNVADQCVPSYAGCRTPQVPQSLAGLCHQLPSPGLCGSWECARQGHFLSRGPASRPRWVHKPVSVTSVPYHKLASGTFSRFQTHYHAAQHSFSSFWLTSLCLPGPGSPTRLVGRCAPLDG